MRRLSENEFDDLQGVLRSHCKDTGRNYKQFAADVGETAIANANKNGATYAAAGKRRETAKKVVKRFLTSPQDKGMLDFVPESIETLLSAIAATQSNGLARYGEFANMFVKGPDYRNNGEMVTFLSECRKNLSNSRPKASTKRRSGPGAIFTKKISKIYNMAARDFEPHNHDVSFLDSSIGDSRYVCIRRSSKNAEMFVVHGLRFAPHRNDSEMYYFSEKYFIQSEDNTKQSEAKAKFGRKSQGLSYVEGAYLCGFARPNLSEAAHTYLHIKIPFFSTVDTSSPTHRTHIEQFDAIISNTNTSGQRFSAACLGFRCANKTEKHTKMGIYTQHELLKQFSPTQCAAIQEWIDTDRFTLLAI